MATFDLSESSLGRTAAAAARLIRNQAIHSAFLLSRKTIIFAALSCVSFQQQQPK
jgi:hypothetical protein